MTAAASVADRKMQVEIPAEMRGEVEAEVAGTSRDDEGVDAPRRITLSELRSGHRVVVTRPEVPGLSDYLVLHLDPVDDQPSPELVGELVIRAHELARTLSFARFGHAEGWSLLLNGAATRRTAGLHVHVVIAGSVHEKRRAFFALQLKHLTRPLARQLEPLTRPLAAWWRFASG